MHEALDAARDRGRHASRKGMTEAIRGTPRTVREPSLRKLGYAAGLTREMVREGVKAVYRTLDMIDAALLPNLGARLAGIVELANLSSILGNVLAAGIVKNCGGVYTRAGAHKFQDLRACGDGAQNVEVKVALETNSPKGHLAEGKAGYYLAVRYVLADDKGNYTPGTRGDVVWIWEVRLGYLEESDFTISNTKGDSGKTAVVKKLALQSKLKIVYYDPAFCPYKRGSDWYLRTYGGA
jgi:hypothetical protein